MLLWSFPCGLKKKLYIENSLTFVVQVVAYNRIFPRGHFVLSLLESNPCFDAKLSGSLYYNLLHSKLYVPSTIKTQMNLALLVSFGVLTKLKVDWHKSEKIVNFSYEVHSWPKFKIVLIKKSVKEILLLSKFFCHYPKMYEWEQ